VAGELRDLLLIVPTRGRVRKARDLVLAVESTSTAATDVVFCVDGDDPEGLNAYMAAVMGQRSRIPVAWMSGPRKTLGGWTNEAASPARLSRYRAVMSLGDDHCPRTPGWDTLLLDAVADGGFAYGDDKIMGERLPTAWVVSTPIVVALGWVIHPTVSHFFGDNIIKDLGNRAGCLRYLPDVVIEHQHRLVTGVWDDTYREAEPLWAADEAAYNAWLAGGRRGIDGDVGKVRRVLDRAC